MGKKGGKNQNTAELDAQKKKVEQLEKEKAELLAASGSSEETRTLLSNLRHQALALALQQALQAKKLKESVQNSEGLDKKVKERDGKVDELQKLIDDKTKENQKLLDQVKKADSKKANKSENDKKAQELQATLDNKNEALAKASEELTLA